MNSYLTLVPPPEAFKYGLNKSAAEYHKPENLNKQFHSKGGKITGVTYFDQSGNGMLTHHEGMDYPTKSIPYVAAIIPVNGVKRMLMLWLYSFNPLTWRKCYEVFTEAAHQLIAQHILKPEFMSLRSRTLMLLTKEFLGEEDKTKQPHKQLFSEIVAHVASEYDDAYSFILGDIANETTDDLLLKRPIREVLRLGRIVNRRRKGLDKAKFRNFTYLLALGLLLPSFRRRFRHSIQTIGIDGLKFDEGDYYWSARKTYYNFGQ